MTFPAIDKINSLIIMNATAFIALSMPVNSFLIIKHWSGTGWTKTKIDISFFYQLNLVATVILRMFSIGENGRIEISVKDVEVRRIVKVIRYNTRIFCFIQTF